MEETEHSEEPLVRVAAIDVAKATGMVCTRVPHASAAGRRVQRVWNVGATPTAILELGDQLVREGITRVVIEAAGTYGGPGSICWSPAVWTAGWSTPVM
ncbi:hypothetical protein [Streptomyces sp. NPDC093707]|uniref:hypothetical protein n=1 Tax=Streptomyces sp. NPDC093707 TaxID=3154984 RepID=UPI003450889B